MTSSLRSSLPRSRFLDVTQLRDIQKTAARETTCVADAIVSASKVLAEELQSRAQNG